MSHISREGARRIARQTQLSEQSPPSLYRVRTRRPSPVAAGGNKIFHGVLESPVTGGNVHAFYFRKFPPDLQLANTIEYEDIELLPSSESPPGTADEATALFPTHFLPIGVPCQFIARAGFDGRALVFPPPTVQGRINETATDAIGSQSGSRTVTVVVDLLAGPSDGSDVYPMIAESVQMRVPEEYRIANNAIVTANWTGHQYNAIAIDPIHDLVFHRVDLEKFFASSEP